jgi:SAM-dependent methyltransferase
MAHLSAETNLRIYDSPETVAHYAALDYLTACERLLFETYIPQGSAVLDLGVGGGRTTGYLAKRASHYVGVDNAPAMIKACRAKFPGLEFVVADAANLSQFPDASFDAVVFAFNGIDFVVPDASRRRCFEHLHRIMKTGAVVIFSSHNARAVLVRPSWNRERLRRIAHRFSANSQILNRALVGIFTVGRCLFALLQASGATLRRVLKRIPSRMFWRGEGDLRDSAHGGLLTHYATPGRVVEELADLFRLECTLGYDYPRRSRAYVTDWYYYVFVKPCEK